MQLQFVPIEAFYFALTLDTRVLREWSGSSLVDEARIKLRARYGEPSTVAAARQNTFNYVFQVENSVSTGSVIEIFDWADQLRLSSNLGLERTASGKVNRLESFDQRPRFAAELSAHFSELLGMTLVD